MINEMVNSPEFAVRVKAARRDPKGKIALKLVKDLDPILQVIGKRVPGSNAYASVFHP